MPNLEQILAHLFQDVDESLHIKLENGNTVKMEDSENAEADAPLNRFQTEVSYLSLDLRDKLDILSYLCTLVLGSKLVRLYIDESESLLTEGRKDRADVNKERRRL